MKAKKKAEQKSAAELPMPREEMKKYTAAELEQMFPGRFSKLGYWLNSKDTKNVTVVIHDMRAVMK